MTFDEITDLAFAVSVESYSRVDRLLDLDESVDLSRDRTVFRRWGDSPEQVHLTPDLQASLCRLISRGTWPLVAAQSCGVGKKLFKKWMIDPAYHDFQIAVDRARMMARDACERAVARQTPERWLAKSFKVDWGDKQVLEVQTTQPTGTIKLEAVLSVEELETLLRLREKIDKAENAPQKLIEGEVLHVERKEPLETPDRE